MNIFLPALRAEYKKKLKAAKAAERKKNKKRRPYFEFLGKSIFNIFICNKLFLLCLFDSVLWNPDVILHC